MVNSTEKNNPSSPEAPKRGFREAIRGILKRGKGQPAALEPSAQQADAESQRLGELRDFLAEEAVVSTLPTWAEKEVSLDDINLRTLPIDWQALSNLGKAVNEIKNDPLERKDLADIKPPASVYPALPMVASVIAHQRNPEIPIVLPTQEEVKAMKPWVAGWEQFISLFSEKLAYKFVHYVERVGGRMVMDIGMQGISFIELIKTIDHPKAQFLKEVTLMYQNLGAREEEPEIGFWGPTEQKKEVKIEDKIYRLLHALKESRTYYRWPEDTPRWLNDQDFPLMLKLLPKLNMPPESLSEGMASVAGAEMMEGVETFLKQQGVKDIGPAPKPREVEFFDMDSWMRGFAETFASDRLERVKRGLPDLLTQAYQVLPSNGPELASKVLDIAENVCVLKAQGRDVNEIAQNIFVQKS